MPLPAARFVPAPGQGALGLEFRKEDAKTLALLEPMRDADTERTTKAERALRGILNAGCHVPLGPPPVLEENAITLHAFLAYPDGRKALRMSESGTDPLAVAEALALRLLAAGAQPILDFARAALKHP